MGPKSDEYSLLKDLRVKIGGGDGAFCICFWVYLLNPTSFPATIIRQVHSDESYSNPFIIINEEKKIRLLPLLFLHKEAPNPNNPVSLMEAQSVSSDFEFPSQKWVHVGCEVSNRFVRLHIDGEIVGEKYLSSSSKDESNSNGSREVTLTSIDGDNVIHGYVHNVEVLPATSSIKDHHLKDPPLQLSIDSSSASEIEEDADGVWSIVGGKASCRRIFSLGVILLDAFGRPADWEREVVASLLYDENGEPVEKPNDAEAPLLATYDGTEFASWDRPSKLLHGRASFKLKISQLSSKCDNKLFRIRFDMPKFGRYPFLEAFSLPIRCISRNPNPRPIFVMSKKLSSNVQAENGSQSSELDDGCADFKKNAAHESRSCPSLKRVKLGEENSCRTFKAGPTNDEECNSHAWTANQVDNEFGVKSEGVPENHDAARSPSSDFESSEGSLTFKCMSNGRNPISDITIFKYCLGSLTERSLLLNEIANSASDQDLMDFAQQVSLYSGCSHHRHQIIIAKRLIEEGKRVWNLISPNKHHVQWDSVAFEIEEQFMKVAGCSTRSLTQQDFVLLKTIAGGHEFLARENFDKIWRWLYPVAFTISREWVNALWGSISPKWIEGFITKEEAESSLQSPRSLQEPGTFILRFPTSRSWPHPDAGSLVVTYVGRDHTLCHRMLSLDFIYSSGGRGTNAKPLQEMLLAEPELSRLGRIRRL